MGELYPLRFQAIFKERVWGGGSIRTLKAYPDAPSSQCGEAWLISGVDGDNSVVINGHLAGNELNELIEVYMGDLVGDKVYELYEDRFPVLLKLIDSNDWLSLQVHPNDELAMDRHGQNGKSELWYVLAAAPGAQLINGFRKSPAKEDFPLHVVGGTLDEYLNRENACAGDVFHIPAGRIHALGPGILLAEIQQTSDITYRIHDWGRTDKDGRSRELHLDASLEAIDFSTAGQGRLRVEAAGNKTTAILDESYFTVNHMLVDAPLKKDYEELDSFVILLCVEGELVLETDGNRDQLRAGESVLIPNVLSTVSLHPRLPAKLLEIFIR